MFPWNIAKSAEAMFSRWAVRRFCKFMLKKKLGKFILGEIDLDQLDVQLRGGTFQLNDLALNVDYVNKKLGAAVLVKVKEGSIGSLLVKMPWTNQGCVVEVDELELVLSPFLENSSDGDGTCSLSHDSENSVRYGSGKLEKEMFENASASSYDVHEGVKTVAKMVKWFLTSYNVKIKRLIVAFDPSPEKEGRTEYDRTLVLRISEIECGTCVSENVKPNGESFLGITRLTNFVKFEGAIVELIQVDDIEKQVCSPGVSGSGFSDLFYPSKNTTPILTGQKGGFSGNMKLSIPWKNGSLDIRKVDADISIDPLEFKFLPSTVIWFLHSWETYKNTDENDATHGDSKSAASCNLSSTLGSPGIPIDGVSPLCGNFSTSCKGKESITEALLPESHIISDWVPFSVNRGHKDGIEEVDFGASVDQFFECFDGLRSSQSALGSSGMWNWTCSVFSAITAASSLASGSLQIPSEQQHVETGLRATVGEITVLFSLHEKEQKHFCDQNARFLGVTCVDTDLVLQVSPREIWFEGTIKYIEVADYLRNLNGARVGLRCHKDNVLHQTLEIQRLQAEVQDALPPFLSSSKYPGPQESSAAVGADFLSCVKGDMFKVLLLKTSGVTHGRVVKNSRSPGPTTLSLKLPPFVFWVNFSMINLLVDLLQEVGKSIDTNSGKKRFPSEVFARNQGTSSVDAKRGSHVPVTTLSLTEALRIDIVVTDARILLCFPFESAEDFGGYSSWDQFVALDFTSSPISSKQGNQNTCQSSNANSQRRYSSTATRSLHLNVGNLDIYLVSAAYKEVPELNGVHSRIFSAQSILSVSNRIGSVSLVSMIWQEGPVTGPWVAKRARYLATLEESRSRYKLMEKGYEFASATTMKDMEELNSQSRQEMILSSAFLLHVQLSSITIKLGSAEYKALHLLYNQIINGLSALAFNSGSITEEVSVPQTSVHVECESVEIRIDLDGRESKKDSEYHELPQSWHHLTLKVEKFNLLSVSNLGGINGAEFFHLAHGEGELWGSNTVVPDRSMLLISCSNSTMKRGDGEGSNALSSRIAGLDIVHLCEPQNFHGFTCITLRCTTVIAVGGRLDWLDEMVSFFCLPTSEVEQTGDSNLPKEDSKTVASFTLNLVDIGLSYEPSLLSSVNEKSPDSGSSCSSNSKEMNEQCISCLLAASSLYISNTSQANSIDNNYKIRVQDLGLLLCAMSEARDLGGNYSVERIHKIGYVKVAREALIEAVLRTNCKNGLLWEIECSKSQIELETCNDTTSGLMGLAAQLQRLFAPDMEESVVHLQARWNNAQLAPDRNMFDDGIVIGNSDSDPSTSKMHSYVNAKSKSGMIGMMDEICENAFSDGQQASQSDSSETQVLYSTEETLVESACKLKIDNPEKISPDTFFKGFMPMVGLESTQTSFVQKGCFPEVIEGYCLSKVRPMSEISADKPELGDKPELVRDSGWYGDSSLKIMENHMSKVSKKTCSERLAARNLHRGDFRKANGRILLKNINVRWRMYAGSDWHSTDVGGRDTAVCIELALSGMKVQYDVFPLGGVDVSKLSLSVKDLHIFDKSRDAPWKLVLGHYHSKDHPRESSSKAFKMELESVRPDPLIPLEEYRLRIAFLPVLLHLHQCQLDFLVSFFGARDSPVDLCNEDSHDSVSSPVKNHNFVGHSIAEEALLPYFQKFDIWPFLVRVDYCPRHVDLAALRGGKYVELVNLVPWKGVELHLKHVQATGVYGWSSVCEAIAGDWLEDISQNQIHKVLQGLPTIRSLVAVGAGAKKLVSLPVESYKKEHRLLKGLQRGTIAFLRSISLEAVGLGVHLAAGAHEILLQAEYILTTVPPSVQWPVRSRTKTNVKSNQPKDAQEGLQQAYESLSDGIGRSASALVRTPLKKYQRGAGAGSALTTAVRGVPAATIAPASACLSAAHFALLGFRNSLDPERKKESMEKYLGPTQLRE